MPFEFVGEAKKYCNVDIFRTNYVGNEKETTPIKIPLLQIKSHKSWALHDFFYSGGIRHTRPSNTAIIHMLH